MCGGIFPSIGDMWQHMQYHHISPMDQGSYSSSLEHTTPVMRLQPLTQQTSTVVGIQPMVEQGNRGQGLHTTVEMRNPTSG